MDGVYVFAYTKAVAYLKILARFTRAFFVVDFGRYFYTCVKQKKPA